MRLVVERFGRTMKGMRRPVACCVSAGFVAAAVMATSGRAEVVEYKTRDSVALVADYFPAKGDEPAPVAILLHMQKSDRSAWEPLAPKLVAAGFAVLAPDMRGHGASGGEARDQLLARAAENDPTLYAGMVRDVEASVDFAIARGDVDASRIALIGAGTGSTAGITYAEKDKSIDVVVLLTPRNMFGLHVTQPAIRYGDRPMLLLASELDKDPIDLVAALNKHATSRVVTRSTAFGTRMLFLVDGVPEQIVEFVSKNVGEPAKSPVFYELGTNEYHLSRAALRTANPALDTRDVRVLSSEAEAKRRKLHPAE